jgi:4-amino-4-deoxy-L-arabinose transferase-like glycosyltransferase
VKDKVERATSTDKEKNRITHARAILVGIILLSFFVRMLWIKTPVVRDEGVAGYVAMVWSRGLTPYSYPMASVNPPITYLIYLASSQLFGDTIIADRMINNALFAISIVFLYLIARDWYDEKVGLISAFFYGIFMNAPIFETHTAIPSSLSIPFIVASVYSFSVYLRNRRKYALFVSGLLMSLASLVLQYQAVGIVLLLAMLIYYKHNTFRQRKGTRVFFARDLIISFCILAIGVVLPVLVLFAYLWNYGALANLLQSTFFRFLSPGVVGHLTDVNFSLELLIFFEAVPLWLFFAVGFVWCFSRRKGYDIFLIAWTIFFLVIAIPPAHFGRHFSQLIPPASLLSGIAIASILNENGLMLKLKRFRSSTNEVQKKATGIFFIVVLLASFIPCMVSQTVQYPNTNFSLFNEVMYYTFSRNWNEQEEIVNYIRSHTSNGSIFIHGWEGELYWLSGNMAPDVRWTSSYRSVVPDITDEEYEKILNRVKAGDFENVLLMSEFPPDEIMRSFPGKYFFVKNIGFYAIYSKYNAEGYSMEYSFIENLPQAPQRYTLDNGTQGYIADLNEPVYLPVVEQITINNESRVAIKQHPIAVMDSHKVYSNIVYDNISILPHSELSFGIGIDPIVWNRTDGVVFKILVQDDGEIHEMFSRYNDPYKNVEDRKWQDYLVDLNQFGNKSISIYFVTDPGPNGNNAYDWAHWSNPLLLEGH